MTRWLKRARCWLFHRPHGDVRVVNSYRAGLNYFAWDGDWRCLRCSEVWK